MINNFVVVVVDDDDDKNRPMCISRIINNSMNCFNSGFSTNSFSTSGAAACVAREAGKVGNCL